MINHSELMMTMSGKGPVGTYFPGIVEKGMDGCRMRMPNGQLVLVEPSLYVHPVPEFVPGDTVIARVYHDNTRNGNGKCTGPSVCLAEVIRAVRKHYK